MIEQTKKQPIQNAIEVIEQFGGIRPMAKKMGVAVTTVQGWKKRNVIPATRYEDVIKAAKEHKVTLSGIVGDEAPAPTQDNTPPITESYAESKPRPQNFDPVHSIDPSPINETILHAELKKAQKAAVVRGTFASLAILAVIIAATFALFSQEILGTINQQDKIAAIESEVDTLSQEVESGALTGLTNILPKDLEIDIEKMKLTSEELQQKVENLTEQASAVTKEITGADTEALKQRVEDIEKQLVAAEKKAQEFAQNTALPLLATSLNELSNSTDGAQKINNAITNLTTTLLTMKEQGASVEEALEVAKQSDEVLDETFEDVSGQELKAAALLIGMSSFRDSLNRDKTSFNEDLALMKMLIGDENEELNVAIEILAPQAENGVLTPNGLSGEFRSMAGDIVISSLKGEDISLQEKTKAKVNEVFSVEKNGELVTGTDTEKKVAQAQKLLDEGKVAEAVAILETLDGKAATAAKPFIKDAEMTMVAGDLYSIVAKDILPKLAGRQILSSTNAYLQDAIK